MIPLKAFKLYGVTGGAILYLIDVLSKTEKDGELWAILSYSRIAKLLGIGKSTAYRNIHSLKKAGVIITSHTNSKENYAMYRVDYHLLEIEHPIVKMNTPRSQNEYGGVVKMTMGDIQNEYGGVVKMNTHSINNSKEYREEISREISPNSLSLDSKEILEKYSSSSLLLQMSKLSIDRQNKLDSFVKIFLLLKAEYFNSQVKYSLTKKERALVKQCINHLNTNQVSVFGFLTYVFKNWEQLRSTITWENGKPRLSAIPSVEEICYCTKDILEQYLRKDSEVKKTDISEIELEYQKRKERRIV